MTRWGYDVFTECNVFIDRYDYVVFGLEICFMIKKSKPNKNYNPSQATQNVHYQHYIIDISARFRFFWYDEYSHVEHNNLYCYQMTQYLWGRFRLARGSRGVYTLLREMSVRNADQNLYITARGGQLRKLQ